MNAEKSKWICQLEMVVLEVGQASTDKEEYENMAAENLKKSRTKNRNEHFNIEICAPVAFVEIPKQNKEPADYHQVE